MRMFKLEGETVESGNGMLQMHECSASGDERRGWFLVGPFSRQEKSPTVTVGSFFSVDNLTLNGPLFLQFLQFLLLLANL